MHVFLLSFLPLHTSLLWGSVFVRDWCSCHHEWWRHAKDGRLVCWTPAAAGGSIADMLFRNGEDQLMRCVMSTFTAAVITTWAFPTLFWLYSTACLFTATTPRWWIVYGFVACVTCFFGCQIKSPVTVMNHIIVSNSRNRWYYIACIKYITFTMQGHE